MHHLIIGSGPAATGAIETIRELDGGASTITLVGDEPAHSRMALPYWLAGRIPQAQVHTGDADYFARLKVDTRIGARVTSIDPGARRVALGDGTSLPFDDLLIATGSSPMRPSIDGATLPGVDTLWTIADTGRVLARAQALEARGRTPRVVLVGAGFIGFIVLNAMHKRGWQLAVIERETHVLSRMLDAVAAAHVERRLGARSVPVHRGVEVRRIVDRGDDTRVVELSDGRSLDADLVILATGVRPNLDALQGSGIATDQAILVDDRMRTSVPNVYAAGDVAQGPVLGGGRAVHAIQPTAVDHGRVAGANMAGRDVRYPGSLSMNVIDVCGLQAASFGDWNDAQAEVTTIDHAALGIYRKLVWRDDRIGGATFTGEAQDLGMLTDVGMVKGLIQTGTRLRAWKAHLQRHPFDVRRAYVGCGVAATLAATALLGRPSRARGYRFGAPDVRARPSAAHAVLVADQ